MRKVYLDNASTNPILPEVREAILPYLDKLYGNPSCMHDWGDAAREGIESAREKVADLIGAGSEDIIFTASGTESNNFAVKGLAQAQQAKGKHIVISAIEHYSVLNSAKTMEKQGFDVTIVPVDKKGTVDPEDIRKSIRKDTILVSVIHGSSEVGTIQPIKEIGKITQEKKVIFHTDSVAAAGNIPVNVKDLGVDALSLASNQFYGPKGAAALWVRKGLRIIPLMDGGVQEGGRRPGTENVPAIVGMGKAASLAKANLESRATALNKMRDRLLKEIPGKIERVIVTGHPTNRLPGHVSFCVEFIEGEAMIMLLSSQGIAVTSGSACTSRALKASHVLIAMGLTHAVAQGSLLMSLGINNNNEDVSYVVETLPPIVDRLRQMSPLYAKYLKKVTKGV
jgi:cysteine desulfurase